MLTLIYCTLTTEWNFEFFHTWLFLGDVPKSTRHINYYHIVCCWRHTLYYLFVSLESRFFTNKSAARLVSATELVWENLKKYFFIAPCPKTIQVVGLNDQIFFFLFFLYFSLESLLYVSFYQCVCEAARTAQNAPKTQNFRFLGYRFLKMKFSTMSLCVWVLSLSLALTTYLRVFNHILNSSLFFSSSFPK